MVFTPLTDKNGTISVQIYGLYPTYGQKWDIIFLSITTSAMPNGRKLP